MFDLARIKCLVASELGGREESDNGWNFTDLLLNPPQEIEVKSGGAEVRMWAVLKEATDSSSGGYTIAFDPDAAAFCLVSGGVEVGYHRSLLDAINGM